MQKGMRKPAATILFALTITLFVISRSQPVSSQSECFQLTPVLCDATQALVQYLAPPVSESNIDLELLRVGFEPDRAMAVDKWRLLPAFIKLEVAYWAAERKSKGSGLTLLSTLRNRLKSRFSSLDYSKDLRELLSGSVPGSLKMQFEYVAQRPRESNLPNEVKQAILSITDLCCHQTYEFTTFIWKTYGLTPSQVYGLMETHRGDWTAVVLDASSIILEKYGHTGLVSVLRNAVQLLRERNAAARHDPRLDPFRGDDPPSTAAVMPSGPKPSGPTAPNMALPSPPPSDLDSATRSYVKQVNAWNAAVQDAVSTDGAPGGAITSFENAVRNPYTAGGVIFGSPVWTAPGLGRPLAAAFKQTGDGRGYLSVSVRTPKGSTDTLTLTDVVAQDLISAHEIYFKQYFGPSKIPVNLPSVSSAVSLVGWLDYTEGNNGLICHYSEIHPAILYNDIGWSSLYADMFMFKNTGKSKYPIDSIKNIYNYKRSIYNVFRYVNEIHYGTEYYPNKLSSIFPTHDFRRTWKVTDVQTVFERSGNRLIVRANKSPAETVLSSDYRYPIGLLRSGFLDIRLLTGKEHPNSWSYSKTFSSIFYANLPMLLASSREFARLNEFSRTMAVMRWLKSSGVKSNSIKISTKPRYTRNPAPKIFVFKGGNISPADAEDGCED